ncbi:aspartate-semialdehyde dehydrogenase [Pendulispora albinea]|uniref:Aspartate-semialdehyde dehydrogenase n=2 Tax=Pendulispora albinea TaxID=2741071 RepID=A0ABZ2MCL8_9BACT
MKNVGIVGFRGMVGSVLMERMNAEKDFKFFEPKFFSTSQAGGKAPDIGRETEPVGNANDIESLKKLDIIVSCQGGDYTTQVFPALRQAGWKGYWIDAASTLRMEKDAIIVLDPVNRAVIDKALDAGVRDFIGGNCTTSLMLMAIAGLFQQGWVEWVSTMTYQAASGAGAKQMRELVAQMRAVGNAAASLLDNPASAILDIDRAVTTTLRDPSFPVTEFSVPLAASLIPWIDKPVEDGQSREEWKGHVETNKILDLHPAVPVDGNCVRIGAMRCHSAGLTIKLKRDIPLADVENAIGQSNDWVQVVPNTKEESIRKLSPAFVSGSLRVPIGRIRKMKMGPEYLSAFTVGDQLLWGAAEPLRRMVRIILER